jgi:hypothetical protein
VTINAINLQWTQSIICLFGTTAVLGSYSGDFSSLSCISPFSGKVSPPTVTLSVSIDGHPPVQVSKFYYYGMDAIVSVSFNLHNIY